MGYGGILISGCYKKKIGVCDTVWDMSREYGGVDRDVETDVNVGYYWCINVDVVQLGHENGD
jgi:hypothetical protein